MQIKDLFLFLKSLLEITVALPRKSLQVWLHKQQVWFGRLAIKGHYEMQMCYFVLKKKAYLNLWKIEAKMKVLCLCIMK